MFLQTIFLVNHAFPLFFTTLFTDDVSTCDNDFSVCQVTLHTTVIECPPVLIWFWQLLHINSWWVGGSVELQHWVAGVSVCGVVVLLNLLFDMRELALQVLTPLPFLQICRVLNTKKIRKNKCGAFFSSYRIHTVRQGQSLSHTNTHLGPSPFTH